MATIDNIKAAFAGESQANRKYLAFAKKADEDGLPQVARLFRAAAAAETVHAHAHLRAMDGVGATIENLKEAVAGETFEFKNMYPGFVAEAEKEGHRRALISFKYAMAVEEDHAGLYANALSSVEAGGDLPAASIYVCSICGHTAIGGAPDRCPICNAVKERYLEVE